MRREGSPWQGLGTVVLKELADHLGSARMRMLEWLMLLTAAAPLYSAITTLRDTTAEDPFLLLKLFTVDRAPLPSFVGILGFLIPLIAIGLGFDAINGEHNRRTLSRILAQPIYRDALLAGKFIASLATLAISGMRKPRMPTKDGSGALSTVKSLSSRNGSSAVVSRKLVIAM